MSSSRGSNSETFSNFVGSFFAQMNKDFKAEHEKRKSEPLYAVTRYFPTSEALPIHPSTNRYTLLRQFYNVLAIMSWFQSKKRFATGLILTPFFNAFLQHIVCPLFDTQANETVRDSAAGAAPSSSPVTGSEPGLTSPVVIFKR